MSRRLPTDDPIEPLLRDFFAREMPPDLRSMADDAAVNGHGRPAVAVLRSRTRRRVMFGSLALAGLVACCVVAGLATDRETSEPPGLSQRDEPPGSPRRDERDDRPLIIVESAEPLEPRTTVMPRRPVEERNDLHWANVRLIDQEADVPTDYTDYVVPDEIAVEIVPVDGDAEPRLTPQPPSDTRLPEERAGDE